MTAIQIESCIKCMQDFNLIIFTNDISTESRNGIPVINLRIKQYKYDWECEPGKVIGEIKLKWDELQFRFAQLSQSDQSAFEDHMTNIGNKFWPYNALKEEGGEGLGPAFFATED